MKKTGLRILCLARDHLPGWRFFAPRQPLGGVEKPCLAPLRCNEESLNRIREYILTSPMRWALDRKNTHRIGMDEFDPWPDSVGKESNGEPYAGR
jgi:hypothetical protein